MGRKFCKFGESSAICQTKTILRVVTINNPLADLFICQTFFHQTLEKSKFDKHFHCQTFPLYIILVFCRHPKLIATYVANQELYLEGFIRGNTVGSKHFI